MTARDAADATGNARIGSRRLVRLVRSALAGADPDVTPPAAVVWVDGAGAEVLVHLDTLRLSLTEGRIVARLDIEAQGWERETLRLIYSVGDGSDVAGLRGVTDDRPAGGRLGERWGAVARAEVWAAIAAALDGEAPDGAGRPRSAGVSRGLLVAEWAPAERA